MITKESNRMNKNPVIIVTAFFDIERDKRGDGRTIDEYKEWMKTTLQLNCNLFIVTEPKFHDFFLENRPKHYNTYIHVMEFKELHYYEYIDRMRTIMNLPEYKSRIMHPNRIECNLPEYCIIQYSKFHCLQVAMKIDKFQSEYFFWMDAGCSRFFLDVDITKNYPSKNAIEHIRSCENQFIIQKRHDLEYYNIDENFVWKSDNLLSGGMFGGNKMIVTKIGQLVEEIFVQQMLQNNNVNNEQLALAIVWKKNPELFQLTNNMNYHLMLFKLLAV